MAELVTMPKLGFDMAEGTLVRWVKSEGQDVAKGEVIAEIETDKATVEVESSYGGVMYRHLVDENTTLPVNAPIAIITSKGEKPTDEEIGAMVEKAGGKPAKKKPEKVEMTGKTEKVEKTAEKQETEQAEAGTGEKGQEPGVTLPGGVRSSPLARKVAEENNVQLEKVEGSGPQGRVVKQDIEDYLESMHKAGRGTEANAIGKTLQPVTSFEVGKVPEDEVIEMSRLRQAIGRRMNDSNQHFPHFYLTRAYDTGSLMNLRMALNQLLPEEDKLSVNDFVIKAVALALRQYPNINASLQDEKHILRHGHI